MVLDPSTDNMPAQMPQNPHLSEGIDLSYLPAGITPGDYANMPPEHQFLLE
jgi:hypothetical protein